VTTTSTTIATRNFTLLAAGGLALAGLGLAAGIALRSPATIATPPEPVAAATSEAIPATPPKLVAGAEAAPAAKPERPSAGSARKAPSESGRASPIETQPVANSCANCGVVEGVRAFERKGEGSGLGAVAGGVVGGALGNQVGKGNGRKAMTVLGALGGGLAGHEIEKRAKSETFYEVRVRMDDGTLRTLTQEKAPAPGARVIVDGSTLRGTDEPRLMRTNARGV
jgi:outer membrane lipoprotein SlyB